MQLGYTLPSRKCGWDYYFFNIIMPPPNTAHIFHSLLEHWQILKKQRIQSLFCRFQTNVSLQVSAKCLSVCRLSKVMCLCISHSEAGACNIPKCMISGSGKREVTGILTVILQEGKNNVFSQGQFVLIRCLVEKQLPTQERCSDLPESFIHEDLV